MAVDLYLVVKIPRSSASIPEVWIGSFSTFAEPREDRLPSVVLEVSRLVPKTYLLWTGTNSDGYYKYDGKDTPLTRSLFDAIIATTRLPNTTRYRVAIPEEVAEALEEYIGEANIAYYTA